MINPEVALYRAVIVQAFSDITSQYLHNNLIIERRRAYDWLMGMGSDMRMICELAEIDPSLVRQKAKELCAEYNINRATMNNIRTRERGERRTVRSLFIPHNKKFKCRSEAYC